MKLGTGMNGWIDRWKKNKTHWNDGREWGAVVLISIWKVIPREGLGRGGCSVLLSVASCLIWRKESLERRVAAWRGLMEIRKRADLMWKHTGLDEAEKWEGNGKSEGMLAKIYGWKQKNMDWWDEWKRKAEEKKDREDELEEGATEEERDRRNYEGWDEDHVGIGKKTGLVGWVRKGGAEVIFSVITEREMVESSSLMGNVHVPCSCQL